VIFSELGLITTEIYILEQRSDGVSKEIRTSVRNFCRHLKYFFRVIKPTQTKGG